MILTFANNEDTSTVVDIPKGYYEDIKRTDKLDKKFGEEDFQSVSASVSSSTLVSSKPE